MNFTEKSDLAPRCLPVQWLDAPVVGPWVIRRHARRVVPRFRMAGTPRRGVICGVRSAPRSSPAFLARGRGAFTLLEMMMVIAIIGFIAAMVLPHVAGFGQANSMSTATRQLLDDVALARQRAMVSRSTVYMVFLPPLNSWTNAFGVPVPYSQQSSNLMMHQYSGYALVSLASVGDQPGQHHPRYVTDWRYLPSGVFIAPFEFNLYNPNYTNLITTNTLAGTTNVSRIYPWSWVQVPFPSLYPPNTNMYLPCIAFTPQGSLATSFTNQYIALARGSIFYPTDTNGRPMFQPPMITETPPGNDANNPNLIQIDWMTGRPTLVQNQFQ